jgi:hypothetical protein
MGPDGPRNQDWLCWWGPAAIYPTRPTETVWIEGRVSRSVISLFGAILYEFFTRRVSPFISLLSLFKKIKVGFWDLCVCVSPYQLLNVSTNIYETWCVYHGTWAHFNGVLLKSLCVPVCVSLLGNGSANTFPRQRIHTAIEKLLDASYLRRVCGSVCVSPIWVHVPPKPWSEGSQSRQTVKYGYESRETRNQEPLCWRGPAAVYWTVYPPIVARQRLGKHVPTATKNCWGRRFLCGPCRIKCK